MLAVVTFDVNPIRGKLIVIYEVREDFHSNEKPLSIAICGIHPRARPPGSAAGSGIPYR
jgi:hypothetical protein